MRRWPLLFTLLPALALSACADDAGSPPSDVVIGDGDGPLVIYSGRKDVLVDPLVERFREATGLEVEVRYGSDAELLAALEEEGEASPADLFWANTAGALGTASENGLFVALPDSVLALPSAFSPSGGRWMPVTVRFRVLAYSPQRVDTTALPASVLALPDATSLRGRVGWTPAYSSFQDFVTALRLTEGERAAAEWLGAMRALDPKAYPSNTPMLEALAAGEIDVALTNHYYVLRTLSNDAREDSAAAPAVATWHFSEGDVGNLALVTGAGLLQSATHRNAARRFLRFLLTEEAQAFAAREVFEYPVVSTVQTPGYLLPFDRADVLSPDLDFERLADLEATLALIREQDLL